MVTIEIDELESHTIKIPDRVDIQELEVIIYKLQNLVKMSKPSNLFSKNDLKLVTIDKPNNKYNNSVSYKELKYKMRKDRDYTIKALKTYYLGSPEVRERLVGMGNCKAPMSTLLRMNRIRHKVKPKEMGLSELPNTHSGYAKDFWNSYIPSIKLNPKEVITQWLL